MSLKPLPSVERLSQRVLRVLGQNPGPFTLQGTNTYLIGSKAPYILLDTGEGKPAYADLLAKAVTPLDISDIILSHWHGDHVDGLPSVLALLEKRPQIWKFPEAEHKLNIDGLRDLKEGQELECADGSVLRVLHTPGHTSDSISLLLTGEGVFTADTVLGQGTTVFEDLSAYMASLHKLKDVLVEEQDRGQVLYPGHGPVQPKGVETVQGYIEHRQMREDMVAQVLKEAGEPLNVGEITKRTYAGQHIPDNVFPAAMHGVTQVLEKLEKEGKARREGEKWTSTELGDDGL